MKKMTSCETDFSNDPCSFSSPNNVIVRHLNLRLNVDFKSQKLSGWADLKIQRFCGAKLLVLDTRDLTILDVNTLNGEKLKFNLGEVIKAFGQKLEIILPECKDPNIQETITIRYETSPNATAIQWLSPEQTAGKKHPYLFTQCQAIHARSLLPIQDSPSVKFPYTAEISVPDGLVALMSAISKSNKLSDNGYRSYLFEQNIPIPSYLIAIVVGDLHCKDIGPRSKVWSEKDIVNEAGFEFSQTEEMLKVAEELMGPYVWGRYDLLVLPPSFSYGGMENPCLTFVTPTLLAGDKSLASVVAHEISHSWTGNLVTNKTPEHFWLNEGHTVFIERKIKGRMFGEEYRHLQAICGWKSLFDTVNNVFNPEHEYTKLVPQLKDVDPDDAFSNVPYEKGSALLMCLEELLGGPEIFEPFLKAYIEKFKNMSITTNDWKDFLYEFFKEKKNVLDTFDFDSWFYKPGMPPNKPKFITTLIEQCNELFLRWITASEQDLDMFSKDDVKNMSVLQMTEFLSSLLQEKSFSKLKMQALTKVYQLDEIKNFEIRFIWIRLGIKCRLENFIDEAIRMTNQQGRMKFVRPLYRDLYAWDDARSKTINNYHSTKSQMHSITAIQLAKDLNIV